VSRALASSDVDAKVAAAYRSGFDTLLDETLAKAAKQFSPYVVEAKVADTWRGFVILDKGYQAGIGKGDVLDSDDAEVRVEFAGQSYAVAVPVLGTPKDGATFSRPATMALSDVRKPRVLALVSDGNTDLPDAVSTQLFTDRLGSNAPFATLPLHANFSQVEASIDAHTEIGHQVSGNRALPDFFIRMVLPPARNYTLGTNLGYKTRQRYQAWAFAELLSRDGRVLYASDVDERIDDTVTDQSGFSADNRKEVVLKNALTELADRFSKDVRFQPVTLKVTDASADSFLIDDPDHVLQPGEPLRVYHDAGRPGSIADDALVPVWDATVTSRDGSKVSAVPVLAVAGKPPKPSSGDVVLLDTVANASPGGQRLAFCASDKNQIGTVSLDRFNELAYASAARAPVMLVEPSLAALVSARVNGQSGFSKTLELTPATYDRCLEALNRIDPKEQKCSDGICTSAYDVKLAYRETANGNAVGQLILQHGFTTEGYPSSTDAQTVNALQSIDLDADTRTNLDAVIKQFLKSN